MVGASANDAFAEAMKIFNKPAVTTPLYENSTNKTSALSSSGGPHSAKAKRARRNLRVSWVRDEDLEAIRWIEKAPVIEGVDDVPYVSNLYDCCCRQSLISRQDENHVDLVTMNHDEGAALHQGSMREEVDWNEPEGIQISAFLLNDSSFVPKLELLDLLTDEDRTTRSYPRADFLNPDYPQTIVQIETARQQNEPAVAYPDKFSIPDSPAEAPYELSMENSVKLMELGPKLLNDPDFRMALEHIHRPPLPILL